MRLCQRAAPCSSSTFSVLIVFSVNPMKAAGAPCSTGPWNIPPGVKLQLQTAQEPDPQLAQEGVASPVPVISSRFTPR